MVIDIAFSQNLSIFIKISERFTREFKKKTKGRTKKGRMGKNAESFHLKIVLKINTLLPPPPWKLILRLEISLTSFDISSKKNQNSYKFVFCKISKNSRKFWLMFFDTYQKYN
jgi:hypothetical protein